MPTLPQKHTRRGGGQRCSMNVMPNVTRACSPLSKHCCELWQARTCVNSRSVRVSSTAHCMPHQPLLTSATPCTRLLAAPAACQMSHALILSSFYWSHRGTVVALHEAAACVSSHKSPGSSPLASSSAALIPFHIAAATVYRASSFRVDANGPTSHALLFTGERQSD